MTNSFIPYFKNEKSEDEMLKRSTDFFTEMNQRRSVRHFSDKNVNKEIIENIIKTASTAPSGANKQPWTFCAISNAEIKSRLRADAEAAEKEAYEKKMSEEWKEDIKPMGTNWHKPFLEIAPWIIVVFRKAFDYENGEKVNTYYSIESTGLATGLLLAAIQNAGLAALSYSPSNMLFLSKILSRPENERPFLVIPIGYPAEDCLVPDIKRKELNEICSFYE